MSFEDVSGPGGKWQISNNGGIEARWSRTGRELVSNGQVLFDLAGRLSDLPRAGVGLRSTPLRDIEGSVH
jgi:hypothetical protein